MNRNDPCSCRSGRKFKKCCLGREAREAQAWKKGSDSDMGAMAKACGCTVEELRARFREAKQKRFKRSTAMAATFMALYGGMAQ